jgi:hypothetical protein
MTCRSTSLLLAAGMAAAFVGQAGACVMRPPIDPPRFWVGPLLNNGNGTYTAAVGSVVGLFPPSITTNCVCGLGLGSADNPAPFGIGVSNPRVVAVLPGDTIIFTLDNFNTLAPNANTSSGLGASPGAAPGATWFGFGGVVQPFQPPALPEGGMWKLLFDVTLPESALPSWNQKFPGQLAGGTGDDNFFPIFTGEHATGYFEPQNNAVPTPMGATLLGVAGLGLLRRRR